MDHLLVSAIWEQAADAKTLRNNRALCQTDFVGINKNAGDNDSKEQSKSHSSTVESKRILKRCPCVGGFEVFVAVLFYFELKRTWCPIKSQLEHLKINHLRLNAPRSKNNVFEIKENIQK